MHKEENTRQAHIDNIVLAPINTKLPNQRKFMGMTLAL